MNEIILNNLDPLSLSRYGQYVDFIQGREKIQSDVKESYTSGDIKKVESTIVNLANTARKSLALLGLGCVIIEREHLWEATGAIGYADYLSMLDARLNIPKQTLSSAKMIAETIINHFSDLKDINFKIENNAYKLIYLDDALETHRKDTVYKNLTEMSFRDFYAWSSPAKQPEEKEDPVTVTVKNDSIFINGNSILNFSKTLPKREKENVTEYLTALYKIRAKGNEPFILDTYDAGEQKAVMAFLKKYRSRK